MSRVEDRQAAALDGSLRYRDSRPSVPVSRQDQRVSRVRIPLASARLRTSAQDSARSRRKSGLRIE